MNIGELRQDTGFIEIEGAVNLRDFGGYATPDGMHVKRGLLYRSGSLSDIPELLHDQFALLDISVICDLRRREEVEESPTPVVPPFDCQVLIPIEPGSTLFMRDAIRNGASAEDVIAFMTEMNREIARDHHESFAELFKQLLETKRGFLLHCSAGKDRTGFGAALILAALGCNEEVIYRDYMLSNQAVRAKETQLQIRNFARRELDGETFHALTGVYSDYLAAAMQEVAARHGSLLGYLNDIGVNAGARSELKSRLVEPATSAAF